jgi:hypothetical protein
MHGFDFSRQNAARDSSGQQLPSVQRPHDRGSRPKVFSMVLESFKQASESASKGTASAEPISFLLL